MSSQIRAGMKKCVHSGVFRALLLPLFLIVLISAVASSDFYERTRRENVAPGVQYYHFANPFGPLNFDVLRVARRERLISIEPVVGDGVLSGLETVARQATSVDNNGFYPIAAINGDFYHAGGMPLGVLVIDREIITAPVLKNNEEPSRPSFVIYSNGQPGVADVGYQGELLTPNKSHYQIIGVNRPRNARGIIMYTPRFGDSTPSDEPAQEVVLGDITGIEKNAPFKLIGGRKYRASVAELRRGGGRIPENGAVLSASGSAASAFRLLRRGSRVYFQFERIGGRAAVRSAVGGWPIIVRNGRNLYESEQGGPRHPRTAIGYNDKEVIFVVADGRAAGWSRGMTFHELGELMIRMKCTDAINLDGGGSSTMWIRGKVRNRVSDGKERAVSNAVVVTSSAPRSGRLEKLVIEPVELSILADQTIQLTATGQDRFYNPVPLKEPVEWNADRSAGTISPNGVFHSASTQSVGRLRARSGNLIEFLDVNVYDEPPIFQIFPSEATLFEEETLQFRYLAMDHQALPVVGDYSRMLQWRATPGMGEIDSAGMFRAGNAAMKGEVTVRMGNVVRRAEVSVGSVPMVLDDFEKAFIWRYGSFPEGELSGSFSITERAAYHGRKGAELRYRFDNRSDIEAAYGITQIAIGAPMAIRIWVKGDGSSNELRLAYRDAGNNRKTVSFEDGTLTDTNWHAAVAKLPPDAGYPLKLESIYVLKNSEEPTRLYGVIFIDDVTALYRPQ